MFFTCHFQEEHSSLDNKNYVESIFILYRIKYQKNKNWPYFPFNSQPHELLKLMFIMDYHH